MRRAYTVRDLVGESPRRRWRPFVGLLCLPMAAIPLASDPPTMLLGIAIGIGVAMLGCMVLVLKR